MEEEPLYRGRRCRNGHGPGNCSRAEAPFKRKGLRMTLTRQVIIAALEEEDSFLSAEELYLRVRSSYPGLGVATVYRTLQLLEELELLDRVETGDGKSRYRLHVSDPKDNGKLRYEILLICDQCGDIIPGPKVTKECIEGMDKLSKQAIDGQGFRVARASLQVYGQCEKCRPKAG